MSSDFQEKRFFAEGDFRRVRHLLGALDEATMSFSELLCAIDLAIEELLRGQVFEIAHDLAQCIEDDDSSSDPF